LTCSKGGPRGFPKENLPGILTCPKVPFCPFCPYGQKGQVSFLTCPKVPFCPFCPYGQKGQVSFALENLKPVVWPVGKGYQEYPSKKALQKKRTFLKQKMET